MRHDPLLTTSERLIRDTLVEKIWEGTVTVMALDVLRSAQTAGALDAYLKVRASPRSLLRTLMSFGSGHAPFSLPFQKRCARILRPRCPTSWQLWRSCRLRTRILYLILSPARRSIFSHKLLFPCISSNTQYGPIRMRPRKTVLTSRRFRDGLRTVD